jgi:hypothetical protein
MQQISTSLVGMTSLEIAERFAKVAPDIAALSKEELAILMHGLYCKVLLTQAEWKARPPLITDAQASASECPAISRLFAAMIDYGNVAAVDDLMRRIDRRRNRKCGHGSVYVAAFADGHIKIGFSTAPEARVRTVAAANQSALVRSWISDGSPHAQRMERLAHKQFAAMRRGGEFFTTPYDEAVTWIAGEFAKHQLAAAHH